MDPIDLMVVLGLYVRVGQIMWREVRLMKGKKHGKGGKKKDGY